MSAAAIEIPDDGLVTFKIGPVTGAVDLYRVHNSLLDINSQLDNELPDASPPARANAFQSRVAALLEDLGFPGASHRAADKFALAVFGAYADLGKEDAPTLL